MTALMRAAWRGRTDVATLLLGAGANMDIAGTGGDYTGKTALDLAREHNHPEIVAAAVRLEYWTPTTHRLCQGPRREWVRFVLLVLLKRLGLPHVVAVVVLRSIRRAELGDGRVHSGGDVGCAPAKRAVLTAGLQCKVAPAANCAGAYVPAGWCMLALVPLVVAAL